MFDRRGKGIVPVCLAVALFSGQAMAEPEFIYGDVTRVLAYNLTTPAVPGPGTVFLNEEVINTDGETSFDDVIALEYYNTKITANGAISHYSGIEPDGFGYSGEVSLELAAENQPTAISVSTTSALSVQFAVTESAKFSFDGLGDWIVESDGIDGTDAGTVMSLSDANGVILEESDGNSEFTVELEPGVLYTFQTSTTALFEDVEPGALGEMIGFSEFGIELEPVIDDPPSDCPADLNGDGSVNTPDLNIVLANFGAGTDAGDVDGDGDTDSQDLVIVLSQQGQSCGTIGLSRR